VTLLSAQNLSDSNFPEAALAVNLAGTMAAFLVDTWKEITTAAP
jgi:hypothetical protein